MVDQTKIEIDNLFDTLLIQQLLDIEELIQEEGNPEAINKIKELIEMVKTV